MSSASSVHKELEDLVAAYALDAVDRAEAELVETHLSTCPRCAEDLAAFREVAALLAHAGGDAPSGLWDRIAAATAEPGVVPPALSIVSPPRPGRSRWAGVAVATAAAAAAAAVVLAVQLHGQSGRIGQLTAAARADQLLRTATVAALQPGARALTLESEGGKPVAEAVLVPGGTGYLIVGQLAALPRSRTYQLWAIVDGRPVSEALLGNNPAAVTFDPAAGSSELAVTDEPAGGSRAPTTQPVAAGALSS